MPDAIEGSCLCGAVTYEVSPPFASFQYCHCSRCRKVSGAAHSANLLVKPDQLTWTAGEAHLGRFALPEAKAFGTCFCQRCGSSLPWTTQNGRWVVVPAGGLDADPEDRPARSIFWDSRPPWYTHVSQLPTFETVPPRKG